MIDPTDTKTPDILGAMPPLAEQLTANLPTHIEALPNFAPSAEPLTDDQLVDGGLAPVQSWMRTSTTKNALRVAKAKEKKAVEGVKQVNVLAPVGVHDTLKALAKASPETVAAVTAVLAGKSPISTRSAADERLIQIGRSVTRLAGWQRWLVLKILGTGEK